VKEHKGYTLCRIDPLEFLSTEIFPDGCFINLVIKDTSIRKKVSFCLDKNLLSRFTLIHHTSYADPKSVGNGCMIYPLSSIYPTSKLKKDVILHSNCLIAEQCQIGTGVFISGGVTIGGSTIIGDYCQINIGSALYDKIQIVEDVVIGAGSVIRKSVLLPGTYSGLINNKIKKIK
jgi:UDP-3-O-[3-hydroxymyristoyl] glucosamine N-acyltransferase